MSMKLIIHYSRLSAQHKIGCLMKKSWLLPHGISESVVVTLYICISGQSVKWNAKMSRMLLSTLSQKNT